MYDVKKFRWSWAIIAFLLILLASRCSASASVMNEAIAQYRMYTAAHEAGHATVAKALGCRVNKITAVQDYELGTSGYTEVEKGCRLTKVQEAALMSAGYMAATFFLKEDAQSLMTEEDRTQMASSDFEKMRKLNLSEDEKGKAFELARNLLNANKPYWEATFILLCKRNVVRP